MTSAPGILPRGRRTPAGIHIPRHMEPRPQRIPYVGTRATTVLRPYRLTLGGSTVHLMEFEEAVKYILARTHDPATAPLAVASANLDHVKHFGHEARWEGALESPGSVEWLTLLDGAPLVAQARRVSGRIWPRLAGSDLTWPILEAAARAGLAVGFLGGQLHTQRLVQERLTADLPALNVAGCWAPERSDVENPAASRLLAAEIAASEVDLLFVCLGKPRQELWIKEHGHLTGAKVMLAFGAAVDFLAGTVRRAPETVRDAGLEWAWRLALEPRRLANRYLVDGPAAYLKLQRHSGGESADSRPAGFVGLPQGEARPGHTDRKALPDARPAFSAVHHRTEVAVLVVAYNSEATLPLLLDDLRNETAEQSIKVIVADNSPTSATMDLLAGHGDVHAFRTGGNLGYAAGINLAMQRAGAADGYLVLNPDIRVEAGSVAKLRQRMHKSAAGAVVPLLLDDEGSIYPSLRREPSLSRALGDAMFGSRFRYRPGFLSEMDYAAEDYIRPHQVDWATGAALLIRPDVIAAVGDWDERYFLYSEETDYLRRIRDCGATVWFEPAARMHHSRGASGSSASLDALMAANRVRYVRKHRPGAYAKAFHGAVILSALLRSPLDGGSQILSAIVRESRWKGLPHSDSTLDPSLMPKASVIIPAHNEEAVLGRTLAPLAPYVEAERIEVVVVCNSCTDSTARVARSFPGVRVLEIPEASKVAALNEAEQIAENWPRLYLDADIELHPAALSALVHALAGDDWLAARPEFVYDSSQADWLVRAYYRARYRMPSQRAHLWGAGAYALNAEGRRRFGEFPRLIADDLFVDALFQPEEKTILNTMPVVVRTPRTVSSLRAILRRTYRGNDEQQMRAPGGAKLVELLGTVRGPMSAFDAMAYAAFALDGRRRPRRGAPAGWERDESSRPAF